MKIVGLTGNIGSGKSTVAKIYQEKNYHIIDADKIGHRILLKEGVAYDEVVKVFGTEILDNKKSIDRKN